MSKWTLAAIAAVLILLVGNMVRFTGKGTGAGDVIANAVGTTEAECVERYSVPAATGYGARAARGMCAELQQPATTVERRVALACILPRIPEARSEDGVKIAVTNCYQQLASR